MRRVNKVGVKGLQPKKEEAGTWGKKETNSRRPGPSRSGGKRGSRWGEGPRRGREKEKPTKDASGETAGGLIGMPPQRSSARKKARLTKPQEGRDTPEQTGGRGERKSQEGENLEMAAGGGKQLGKKKDVREARGKIRSLRRSRGFVRGKQ